MASVAVTHDTAEVLTADETRQLQALEGVIDKGIQTFKEVGNALGEIRDTRLYRADHPTFDGYCRERWALSGRRGFELITAAGVAEQMRGIPHTPEITNEGQANEVAKIVKDHSPEVAAEVLQEVAAEGKVTAAGIKAVAVEQGLVDPPKPKPAAPSKVEQESAQIAAAVAAKKSQAPATPAKKPATKPAPKTRKPRLTSEQLDSAARALGTHVYGMAKGQIDPRAAAQVVVNTLQGSPKVLQSFVDELNRAYAEGTTP